MEEAELPDPSFRSEDIQKQKQHGFSNAIRIIELSINGGASPSSPRISGGAQVAIVRLT